MNTPNSPRLDCPPPTTDHTDPAKPTATPPDSGAPKVAAEGVLSAVRPDPQQGDGRDPIAWLHITAPGRGVIPTATSICECGRNSSAVGQRKVLALIEKHTAHRGECPLRAVKEDRTAA
ncbi:hypothetical protein [Streptomyces sioyaensis]|uniref:hypothetical protein n=1 Tax=Streptomyces sioyaensis TaxID=67364 RepID=UPI00371FC745